MTVNEIVRVLDKMRETCAQQGLRNCHNCKYKDWPCGVFGDSPESMDMDEVEDFFTMVDEKIRENE